MSKIDIDKLMADVLTYYDKECGGLPRRITQALEKQGLEYRNGEICEAGKPDEQSDKDRLGITREEFRQELEVLYRYADEIQYQHGYEKGKSDATIQWSQEDKDMVSWLIRCCEREHNDLCNDKYGHEEIVSDLKRDCRKKWDWLEKLQKRMEGAE